MMLVTWLLRASRARGFFRVAMSVVAGQVAAVFREIASGRPTPWRLLPVALLMGLSFSLGASSISGFREAYWGKKHAYLASGVSNGVNGVLTFILAPVFGAMSDKFGRKPFLVFCVVIQAFKPISLIWYHDELIYELANGLTGFGNFTYAMCFSMVADICEPSYRLVFMSLTMSMFACGSLIGAQVGGYLAYIVLVWAGVACGIIAIIYSVLCVPESLQEKEEKIDWRKANVFASLSALLQSRLVLMLGFVVFLGNISESAVMDMLLLYLQDDLAMGRKEQGTFLTLLGGLSFAGQAAALPLLKLWVSDVFVLRLAYFCNAMHCLMSAPNLTATLSHCITFNSNYGIAVAKWQVYSNVVLVVFTELSFPAVSAITSGHVQKQRVGVALTAISGVKSLTNGIGPFLFGLLFSYRGNLGPFAHLSGFPFFVGGVFVLVAFLISLFLPLSTQDNNTEIIAAADGFSPVVSRACSANAPEDSERRALLQPEHDDDKNEP